MRLIAFYLPQFHPIPENDVWWGKGFTEWTNVAKARPLFPWHEQPFLPGELGFYDLRLPEIRRAQAELARTHGIHGFCYYHYWFGGRQLLERPFEEVLRLGEPDLPFCLCWANENWTRAWDGRERDVLIHQRHSDEDDREHIRFLARAFRDPRYIRVNGRPVLLVYRTSLLGNCVRTAAVWREESRALGIAEPYLCTVESLREDRAEPGSVGFDAAVEFQPDWLNVGEPSEETEDGNRVFDYEPFVKRQLAKPAVPYTRFPCVTPNWDNTARRQHDAFVMRGSTPELFEGWLEAVIETRRTARPGEDLVFINSWNEWGEGAQLEPSRRWGRAYLEATKRAVSATAARAVGRESGIVSVEGPAGGGKPLVTVCIPTFNGARYVGPALQSVLGQTLSELEVIVVDDASSDETAAIVRTFSDRRLSLVVNPVRLGIAGNWNRCLDLAASPIVCLFHQDDLMMAANLAEKVRFLERNPSAGMVFSNVWQIGPSDEVISTCWYAPPDPADGGLHAGAGFFRRLLRGPNIVCCPGVVARREVFDVVGGFDRDLPFTLDWEMWLRIATRFDVGYLVEALVKYRRHPDMETNRFAGVRDLEEAIRAKRRALGHANGWIPDAEALLTEVQEASLRDGLDRAGECYRTGRLEEARGYLEFALEMESHRAIPRPPAERAAFMLSVLPHVAHGAPAPAGPAAAPASVPPAEAVPPRPLLEQALYWQSLAEARAVDISHMIALEKLVSAARLKAGRKTGLGWLPRVFGDDQESG